MQDKVVDLARKPYVPPVSDFWFAQVDHRLNRIEAMVRRLEWQIWLIVCSACALLVLSIVDVLQP